MLKSLAEDVHMQKLIVMAFLMVCGAQAQQVNVRGKVTDGTGAAVANATVEIAKLKLKDTTGADGNFAISGAVTALRGSAQSLPGAISFSKGVLELTLD